MSQKAVNTEARDKNKKYSRKNSHFRPHAKACRFKIAAPTGKIYHYNDLKEWLTKYGVNYPELIEESVEVVYEKLIETRDRFIEEKITTDYKGWKLLTTRFDKHDNNKKGEAKPVNGEAAEKSNKVDKVNAVENADTEVNAKEKVKAKVKDKSIEKSDGGQISDSREKTKSKKPFKKKNKPVKNQREKSEQEGSNKKEKKLEKEPKQKPEQKSEQKPEKKPEQKSEKKSEKKSENKPSLDKYSQILQNAEKEMASIKVQTYEEEKQPGFGDKVKGFFAGLFGKN